MRDDQTRVLVSDWNSKIKKFIPVDPSNENMTPRFGWVIDQLRIQYGIYVYANPVTNSELSEEGPSQSVYNFKGTATYIKGGMIYKHAICNDISYTGAIRQAINLAIGFLQ